MKYYSRSGGDYTYAVEQEWCKLLNIDCYSLATNLIFCAEYWLLFWNGYLLHRRVLRFICRRR